MTLSNPYLEFFCALPVSFRRNPLLPISSAELALPDWLSLKGAVARHFSWAVPNDEAIACIRRHAASVIEIGAGSGYWAWLMRQAGIDVAAFDTDPPPFTWVEVGRGDGLGALNGTKRTLFLCWPPWRADMALNALTAYRGTCVIYVGEWMLGAADTRFFALLASQFEAVDAVQIPQWFARADRLLVFRRRSSGTV